uniref:Candidate secreted effector n=1 Tax=Meloidogyne incognita TaxID=6306 RepID=A0A914ND04_MELIC
MKILFNLFFLFFILLVFIENISAEIRFKRQYPMFIDWTAPRRGSTPQGGNGF